MTATNPRAEAPISHRRRSHSSGGGGGNSCLCGCSSFTPSYPPAAFTPPSLLPPLPGDAQAGSRAGEAGRGTRHVRRNTRATFKLSGFLLPPGWQAASGSCLGAAERLLPPPKPKQNNNPPQFLSPVVS